MNKGVPALILFHLEHCPGQWEVGGVQQLCYSRMYGGRRHWAWSRNDWKGGIAPCLLVSLGDFLLHWSTPRFHFSSVICETTPPLAWLLCRAHLVPLLQLVVGELCVLPEVLEHLRPQLAVLFPHGQQRDRMLTVSAATLAASVPVHRQHQPANCFAADFFFVLWTNLLIGKEKGGGG